MMLHVADGYGKDINTAIMMVIPTEYYILNQHIKVIIYTKFKTSVKNNLTIILDCFTNHNFYSFLVICDQDTMLVHPRARGV